MPITNNIPGSDLNRAQDYMPAALKHNTRGWYIEYFVFNPATGRKERVRESVNKLHKKLGSADFKRQTAAYIANLNVKIFSGWSPFAAPTVSVAAYSPIREALEQYKRIRLPELERSTQTAYKSIIGMFVRYLDSQGAGDCYACSITKQVAIAYMDYRGREISNNAYNSDLKKLRSIFGWLQERQYLTENPFKDIKVKKKTTKIRGAISLEVQNRVATYCRKNMPGFLVVLHLIYNSFIRPKEIVTIQIKHIHIMDHYVLIPAEFSKTDIERKAPLTDEEVILLSEYTAGYPSDYYLVGTDYHPSRTPTYIGKYKKTWQQLRKQLDIPEEMQLYSWKDTGISDMLLSGTDALTVMHAADHHDLTTTTKYEHLDTKIMIQSVRRSALAIDGTANPRNI